MGNEGGRFGEGRRLNGIKHKKKDEISLTIKCHAKIGGVLRQCNAVKQPTAVHRFQAST